MTVRRQTMLFSFWVGPLTWVERLCMTSMIRSGHSLTVYSFEPLEVPYGVTVKDARQILPEERVIFHRQKKSPALFADLFRYEGLQRGLGIWVDLDVLVLRNLSDLGENILGLEDERWINGAVLRLPKDSPILRDILEICGRRVFIAPYWSHQQKIRQRLLGLFGLHRSLADLPWGSIGPRLLTYCARKHNLKPLPKAFFYPYGWREADIAFGPSEHVEQKLTRQTYAVHLWNEMIKERKKNPPPRGSFLAAMCDKYGVAT